jgi:uncharacterized protein (DUF2235 family)
MRRLVVCCDGTWKAAESSTITNVTYMARAIAPISGLDAATQVVFYDPGVGTGNFVDRFSGGAFGDGLDANIVDAYRFLVYNYSPGDQVFFFGFSRGAYTARSTVGMLRKCGLLKKVHADRVGDAYGLYRKRNDTPDGPRATRFRDDFCWPAFEVEFLGVWDTVGSLGIPLNGLRWFTRRDDQFHDTTLSRIVRRAYHAVAIDERRGAFKPTLWERQPDSNQKVEQAWFTGVHSDVGGGYEDRGLANITFQWMAKRAYDAGLEFDHQYLEKELGVNLVQPSVIDNKGYTGELHNSLTDIYLLMPRYTRVIGMDSSKCETVWHTAKRRADEKVSGYAPQNLSAYLNGPDPAIAGPDVVGV